MKIEILNYLEGLDFDAAYRNRHVVELDKLEISLIDVADLITNKRAVGRPQDLADVAKLEEMYPEHKN